MKRPGKIVEVGVIHFGQMWLGSDGVMRSISAPMPLRLVVEDDGKEIVTTYRDLPGSPVLPMRGSRA